MNQNSHLPKKYYTVRDIMFILTIGKNKAYSLVQEGGIPHIKIGKTYRIPVEEFNVWHKEHVVW